MLGVKGVDERSKIYIMMDGELNNLDIGKDDQLTLSGLYIVFPSPHYYGRMLSYG